MSSFVVVRNVPYTSYETRGSFVDLLKVSFIRYGTISRYGKQQMVWYIFYETMCSSVEYVRNYSLQLRNYEWLRRTYTEPLKGLRNLKMVYGTVRGFVPKMRN